MYKDLRVETIEKLAANSITITKELPSLEQELAIREQEPIVGRLICLFIVVVYAYHNKRDACIKWLEASGYDRFLADSERNLLYEGIGSKIEYRKKEEALYALAYVLGIAPSLDFKARVPKEVVDAFPSISKIGSETIFISKFQLRSNGEVLSMLDLYYCLDWYCVNSMLYYGHCSVLPYIVRERRRALEWVLHNDLDWDNIELDT